MRVAGFPSPADEYGLVSLSLHELLIPRPTSTFFVRVVEDLAPNIRRDDILIVDRSLKIKDRCLALIVLNGQFCLRRIEERFGQKWLCPLGPGRPLPLQSEEDSVLWGVVAHVVHRTYVA